eukprot:CAMPEP_0182544870 /NCGR_PEP_ID=MMETSP1323-20130603/33755_1 /TAXON_ID=236787 /ORGANISM="Florenciella parvula, Strain RCC1693" /LENGTH=788 /DNA_ID=CAMNT_0024755961 /DNA_START=55 /DNA_END=2421 /DNA_ORIENTATION=-
MRAYVALAVLAGGADAFTRSAMAPRRSRTMMMSQTLKKPAAQGNGIGENIDVEQMRPRLEVEWTQIKDDLKNVFGLTEEELAKYDDISKDDQMAGYEMMQMCRQFENACNQAYMQGNIRGFMHLDNGQETIPAFVADSIRKTDIKYSYYREHTHALASGVDPKAIMAELFAKETGTCKGTGGSMHIYDKDTFFQGGWALVCEQLPYAVGAARSILLDRKLGIAPPDDDRMAIVFVGEGGAQNGRMAECLNAAAKENLPILFLVIDNGRAINTYTMDVATNSDVFAQGAHYGVPGVKCDGQNMVDVMRAGRAVTDYVRGSGPAIMQVHTFRFTGHSPADPEHERGRKFEKKWARDNHDPLKLYEESCEVAGEEELTATKKKVMAEVKEVIAYAKTSPEPPASLAKELEFPDAPDTDYNTKTVPDTAAGITTASTDAAALARCEEHIVGLKEKAAAGQITIGDAVNLAILEEMIRDPMTTIHAEDLQAGSSYDIPKLTQQTFGTLRAADEIIDEGHFIGKALGEGMNGYRPIVELMNTNFGIYGMAELSSAGNTYATTGGQFEMPMTIIGAGGTAPNQALGAEHSQPFHAYVMGIPGLKICTASSPEAAYGIAKSMIRDNGPGILFLPVKQMKSVKGSVDEGVCLPMNKARVLHKASDASISAGKAVTVLTYLHGVKESLDAMETINADGNDIELIELTSLKPLDMDTIRASLEKTHKIIILDESTLSGGVGATVSALISERCFDELDAPVRRLCMDDAPVPYAASMEKAVVKRGSDLIEAVRDAVAKKL